MTGDEMADAVLISEPIDTKSLASHVACAEAGAVVIFEGAVRNRHKGKRVDYIIYDAYPEMAEKKLREVAERARGEFDVLGVALAHRVGKLGVGEVSVAVAISAEHREAAFAACRFVIDEVKRTVPIWKKEGNSDGEEWIETQHEEENTGHRT